MSTGYVLMNSQFNAVIMPDTAVIGKVIGGASSVGMTSGASTDASYLVLGLNSTLSAERVLTAGSNISFADTGANGTLTISSTGAADGDAQILAWLGL